MDIWLLPLLVGVGVVLSGTNAGPNRLWPGIVTAEIANRSAVVHSLQIFWYRIRTLSAVTRCHLEPGGGSRQDPGCRSWDRSVTQY